MIYREPEREGSLGRVGRRRQDGVRDRDARVKGVGVLYGRRAHQRCTDAAERYRWRFLLVTRSRVENDFFENGRMGRSKERYIHVRP